MSTELREKEEGKDFMAQVLEELPTEEDINRPSLSLAVKLTHKLKTIDTQVEMYENWLAGEMNRLASQRKFIYSMLEPFMLDYYQKTTCKMLHLPNGSKLQLRKCPDSLDIENEDAAINWAMNNNPGLCSSRVNLMKAKVMDYIKETGVLPPGITIKQGKELSFSVSY